MQRSLDRIPQETWYYYTFYNSYDDEQREYRYEPNTKHVERIQSKSCQSEHQYTRPIPDLHTMEHGTLIRDDSADVSKARSDATVGAQNQMLHFTEDQHFSRFPCANNNRSKQLEEAATGTIYQELAIVNVFVKDVARYFSAQYEKGMHILTLPEVATGLLLSNVILLAVIIY